MIKNRLQSFAYAIQGLCLLLKTQVNFRIHLVAAVAVVLVALLAGVTAVEWCILIFAIAIVWAAEAINTAIEALCNAVSLEFHPQIKVAKDVAAAAVLISAIAAALLGLIVLGPYVLGWMLHLF